MQILITLVRTASRSLAMLAVFLLVGAAVLAACSEIHPDNTPFSPHGRGR
jgi:hypothetical protein